MFRFMLGNSARNAKMLRIVLSSLKLGSRGSVTGQIWFDDGDAFPEVGWSDFPVVLVTWWLDLLARLLSASDQEGRISFMDGPFRVQATCRGDFLRLDFVSEHPGVKSSSRITTLAAAIDNAKDIARALVGECGRRGWASREIESLRRALAAAE
jgi:hypothetical protein